MSSEPNEHITKGEKIEFDCGTVATLTHLSPVIDGKMSLAGISLNSGDGEGGFNTPKGAVKNIEVLFYIRNIPSIIYMLQRIYKTGMGTH